MNRHDLSDKHMRKRKVAKQEEENLSTEKLKEKERIYEEVDEEQWRKDMLPTKLKSPK